MNESTERNPTRTMDNSSDFASGFVKIAMEEYYAHNSNNLTGLVMRYWNIVDQELAGNNTGIFTAAVETAITIRGIATHTQKSQIRTYAKRDFLLRDCDSGA